MDLNTIFQKCCFKPNTDQRKAIEQVKGPLLIIAGPGSGKTEVLIYRTINLILCYGIKPENILLCTFTEKAAEQLKTRLKLYLGKCNRDDIDLNDMALGTIHSICNNIIQDNINDIHQLHKNYEVLEDLTQALFIYNNFNEIVSTSINDKYFGKWAGKWRTIEELIIYFNKITEECIDVKELKKDNDPFLKLLAESYIKYVKLLEDTSHIDFSFQQKHVLNLLLRNNRVCNKLKERFQYILVDEYQDTNYLQEQIMLTLAKPENNICVVGDEDQALYRFRGATVRNILEFKDKFPRGICNQVKLDINYRSHKDIIKCYNDFMDDDIWFEGKELKFRFNKSIKPDSHSSEAQLNYDSVVGIQDEINAPKKIADLILYLKDNKIITDLNQVAFFMRSIAFDNIKPFLDEFGRKKIAYYAPRAKKYFENEEIKELIACYVKLLTFDGDETPDDAFQDVIINSDSYEFCFESFQLLKSKIKKDNKYAKLNKYLENTATDIYDLKRNETLDIGLIEIFYQIISFNPFFLYLEDEACARNLSIFSRLVLLFQQFYDYQVITGKNKGSIVKQFFNSYLYFLISRGVNEYEDKYDIFPTGRVQVMTIHQAKGLEFPVVFYAGLQKKNPPVKIIDKELAPYYRRKEFEPFDKIIHFDQMRLSYVAFSRPQNLLFLVAQGNPFRYYQNVFENIPDYNKLYKKQWLQIKVKKIREQAKKLEYSFTSHINLYDTCPKQYLMYKEYEFTPARAAQIVFGALIHQTIEDIHRHVIDKIPEKLTEEKVLEYLENNKRGFIQQGVHPFNEEAAREHILNYYKNNADIINKVRETEYEVVLEKNDYYIKGILDLISGDNGQVDIYDFKSQMRPEPNSPVLEQYQRQLAIYSHIVEKKKGEKPTGTYIYWTGEEDRNNAIMQVNINHEEAIKVIEHFDNVVQKIRKKDFKVTKYPSRKVCDECDFRFYCRTGN